MAAFQLAADDHIARGVNAVDLKNRLRDIETDCRNPLHGWLPRTVATPSATTQWHLRAGGGAVHSIKSGHSITSSARASSDWGRYCHCCRRASSPGLLGDALKKRFGVSLEPGPQNSRSL